MIPIHRIALLLITLALGLATTVPSRAQRGNPRMEFAGQSIDAMIADFMAEHAIPGLSLAIVQAPYIPRASGHGLADIATSRLVGTNTLFDLGQMTDAYTAVAVMQLVESGKLRLDDRIGAHLSHLPASWQAIAVKDLLAHASGLPDYTLDPSHDPMRAYGLADIVSLIGGRALLFRPGYDVANSRTDYALLVRLVEAASGQPHQVFIRVNQLDRLGLRHTFFPAEMDPVRSEDVARNNNRHKDFLVDPVFINPTERAIGHRTDLAPAAAGQAGILASASDVSLWDIGLAGGILVKDPALRAILYQPATLADGRRVPVMGAWRFPGRKGLMYVTGDAHGQSAFLSRFTDASELVCVTLLANKAGVDLTQLARRIAGAYDKRLGPPDDAGLRAQQSPYPVEETLARFEHALRSAGVGFSATPERIALTDPVGEARVWMRDGQVWVTYRGGGMAMDRVLLRTVTPY